MAELTQRKIGPLPSLPLSTASTKGVRVTEFDSRPVCANETPRHYMQHGDELVSSDGRSATSGLTIGGLSREIQEMFLPAGYPNSVSEDYVSFQLWDTIQAMCSYLRGVLATQSVLQSVGVGNDTATPLAAALQWVLRDGSGMIGGLTFAYLVGPKFDLNVKRWRLFADVVNDVGLTLDMIAPLVPTLVTEVLCLSSIFKTMCGVAVGATRSSLMTHFAKRDNMADCAAKEGSQETAVKLCGLIVGMYFANAVNESQFAVWVAFLVLTLVHVYANYNAVSCLCIPTVNILRGSILVQRFLKSGTCSNSMDNAADQVRTRALLDHDVATDEMNTICCCLLSFVGYCAAAANIFTSLCVRLSPVLYHTKYSIRSVNQKEPVFSNPSLPVTSQLTMGSQLHEAALTSQDLDKLLQIYAYDDDTKACISCNVFFPQLLIFLVAFCMLHVCREEKFLLTVVENHVHVMFQADANPNDELRAFFQAILVLQALTLAPSSPPSSRGGKKGHLYLLESTHHQMMTDFPLFLQVLENHSWRTHMYLLNTTPWRIKIGERT
uniref:Uncharacterized protein n=1 Tax=Hyaloperonospora arabidopsidis (strain Emoy2) TaxID=559515 RepID=M4BWZ3_HYAAE